nr:PAAR domain-containing protein [Acinetobacter sp. Marseille-Q1620]
MATPYITIGCPTTGGGVVQEGDSSFLIEGIPIACVGHKATCLLHKTVSTIISGDQYFKVGGKPAARAGDGLSCGCKLLPKQSLVVGDNGGGASKGAVNIFAAAQQLTQENFVEDKEIHKIQFEVIDEDTQQIVPEMLYEIYSKDSGELLVQGYTDESGMTALYESKYTPESIELVILDISRPIEPI